MPIYIEINKAQLKAGLNAMVNNAFIIEIKGETMYFTDKYGTYTLHPRSISTIKQHN
jgi:hypothetical protein